LPIEHIKNHEFFQGITWGVDLWKQKAPRLKAYSPPPREPIKLNGSSDGDSFPPSINTAPSNTSSRVVPRLITELPAPSQLDIEWSPVLTKNNERILKLGNLVVLSSPASHSPVSRHGEYEAPRKFSRFFGGSTTKKRQRLVMITSSGRIIMAAAGGDEKKTKMELSLLAPGTHYRTSTDAKGVSCWIVDTVRIPPPSTRQSIFFSLTGARVAREAFCFRGSQTVIKQCGHNRFNYAGVVGYPRPSSRDGSGSTK
jgi:3-phosphoinositide dependent protein kinase-1